MGVNISAKTLSTVFILNAQLSCLCKHCFFFFLVFLSLSLSLWISWLNECDLVSEVWAAVPELETLCMNIKCVCGICVWGLKLEITSLTNQLWASLSVCLCTRRKEGVDWEKERERETVMESACFYEQDLQKLGAVRRSKPQERSWEGAALRQESVLNITKIIPCCIAW